jgi:hypothetical protein
MATKTWWQKKLEDQDAQILSLGEGRLPVQPQVMYLAIGVALCQLGNNWFEMEETEIDDRDGNRWIAMYDYQREGVRLSKRNKNYTRDENDPAVVEAVNDAKARLAEDLGVSKADVPGEMILQSEEVRAAYVPQTENYFVPLESLKTVWIAMVPDNPLAPASTEAA